MVWIKAIWHWVWVDGGEEWSGWSLFSEWDGDWIGVSSWCIRWASMVHMAQ